MTEKLLHDTYLPFTKSTMLKHFAPVGTDITSAEKKFAYYQEKADIARKWQAGDLPAKTAQERAKSTQQGIQIQKNERFWIAAALLAAFYAEDRSTALEGILASCLGHKPPFSNAQGWNDALGNQQNLYFEVSLPAPEMFQDIAAGRIDERVIGPHKRSAAQAKADNGRRLEGSSVIDALLVSPDTGFAAIFEAKVTSDISSSVTHDETRNQIARNVDVMLDSHATHRTLHESLKARDVDRSCFILITPELFKKNPTTRLYGWLMEDYKNPSSLIRDLPHRPVDILTAASSRMGWTTWEEINRLVPGACGWL